MESKFIGLFCWDQNFDNRERPPHWVDPVLDHVREIKRICNLHNIPVEFVLLPSKGSVSSKMSTVLDGVQTIAPTLLTLDDFTKGLDDHPNNSGHKKIAEQMEMILSKD